MIQFILGLACRTCYVWRKGDKTHCRVCGTAYPSAKESRA
jgi:RNA polymerase subunit RPABC4/transcription elongation factor Spt4